MKAQVGVCRRVYVGMCAGVRRVLTYVYACVQACVLASCRCIVGVGV